MVERKEGPLVMLVDDDVAIAEMYGLGLASAGFRVRLLADPHALFRALHEQLPDILVLDWQMPGMNGAEALELIRLDERTKHLPVFMLSNFLGDQNGAIDRVFEAGALAWLRKSVTPPSALAQRLSEALARHVTSAGGDDRSAARGSS
jgi:two-component system, OmpR family, phosphate regulon response regulator PhoB